MICALGTSADECAGALAAGRSGIRTLDVPHDPQLGADAIVRRPAARVPVLPSRADADPALLDPVTSFALIAGREAWSQSKLPHAPESAVGVYIGTGMGGAASMQRGYVDILKREIPPQPLTILSAMANAPAAHLSMRLGLKGPNLTFSSACASSATAIGEALHAIRHGRLDCVLAGGAEACVVAGVLRGWESLRILAPAREPDGAASCRPFSRDREGIVLGEGAALCVLESLESAERRGAPVLAELLGYGAGADASHIAIPNVDGQARAISAALHDAGLRPADIDYVNAHGTGTRIGDACETLALKRVFGERAGAVPVSSTKSVHGHLLGAAGALELAAGLMAMRGRFLPATMHLGEPDPDCDLDYVANAPRRGVAVRRFMSNSFAFGGSNAVLIAGELR
jgi:3-oxoacyl-[acyl-carrier-protein] synthase II